jgi:phosphatidate cytidylyltransferase
MPNCCSSIHDGRISMARRWPPRLRISATVNAVSAAGDRLMASAMSELQKRIISGVLMILVALGALVLGGYIFWALISLLAVLMMREWAGMMKAARWKIALALGLVAAMQAYALLFVKADYMAAYHDPLLAQAIDLTGASAILLAVVTFSARLGAGILYVVLPSLSIIFLRQQDNGLALTLWMLVVVWSTDIGAYFAGRAIGGPKLAPRISPNKTWAGLVGGMAAALIFGALLGWSTGLPHLFWLLGAPLAVAAQAGDLFESWLKRTSGVKDSGRILPGHGGVLDRLDGVVPVAILVAGGIAIMGALHGPA